MTEMPLAWREQIHQDPTRASDGLTSLSPLIQHQRALEHLLGWEREGYANCTLVAAEAAKKRGGHLTAL